MYSTCTNAILCALFVWNALFVHWKAFQDEHSLRMASPQGLPLLRVGYIRVPGSLYLGSQTPLNGPYYLKLKIDFLKLGGVISWDEGGGGRYDLAENDATLV